MFKWFWTIFSLGAPVLWTISSLIFFFFFFVKGADVEARDYSGRKPKHYIKESMSLWLQSKFMD